MKVVLKNKRGFDQKGADSVLDALSECRVFWIERREQGEYLFFEGCDGYFNAQLTKDQMLMLIDELKAMVENEPL